MTLDELTAQVLELPVASREKVDEQVVESLVDDGANDESRQAWAVEAIRRRDEVRSDKVRPIPGEQVLAEVRRVVGR